MPPTNPKRPTLAEVEPIQMKSDPAALLNAVYTQVEKKKYRCSRCGEIFQIGDNNIYSCHGHQGELVLDRALTTQNITLGVAVGAVAGTLCGVVAGALIIGKAGAALASMKGLSGLNTMASLTSGYSVTSATAATVSPVTTGVAVGTTIGAAGGGVRSVASQVGGAYVWSCCGHLQTQRKCPSRTGMHVPILESEIN
eukprot:PhF_6_TR19736/c0_g1_i1/m.28803